jgi:hypothetical protein
VQSDIEWGEETLADHVPSYEPQAFALPYGSYGEDGTNDPRIPDELLGWLTEQFDVVFTQDVNARAQSRQSSLRRAVGRSELQVACRGLGGQRAAHKRFS